MEWGSGWSRGQGGLEVRMAGGVGVRVERGQGGEGSGWRGVRVAG